MKRIEISVIGPYVDCSIWRNGRGRPDPAICFIFPPERTIRIECVDIAVIGPYVGCSIWCDGWGSLDPSACFKLPLKCSIRIKCIEVTVQKVEYVNVIDICSHVDRSIRGNSRGRVNPVSYTHLRAHETVLDLVC